MATKKENTDGPKKRGPGRPRKSKVEKINIEEYLDNKKVKEFENAIVQKEELEKIKTPNSFPETKEELQDWTSTLASQINQVTEKLKQVDDYYKTVQSQVKKYSKFESELTNERLMVKRLIYKDQDKIYRAENKMANIDPNIYRADLPNFLRPIVKFFTRKEDEILLRREIAESEAKIFQRNTRLVEINADLSKAIIAHKGSINNLQAVRSIIDDYRAVRMNLGRIQREIQENIKAHKNRKDQNLILENYIANIQKLGDVGSNFITQISESRDKLTGLFDKIQKLPFDDLDHHFDIMRNDIESINDIKDIKDR